MTQNDVHVECEYKCKKCGQKWTAFDDVVIDGVCPSCSYLTQPSKVSSYNLSQVRRWSFWEQVEEHLAE